MSMVDDWIRSGCFIFSVCYLSVVRNVLNRKARTFTWLMRSIMGSTRLGHWELDLLAYVLIA